MSEIYSPGSIAGPAGPPATFMGPYNPGTSYSIGQAVSSGGSSYVSLVNSNAGNNPASSPTQWALLAAAGANGAAGSPGSAAAVSALAGAVMPSFVGRNLFDFSKITRAMQVNAADGTLTPGAPTNATALIYCPGATSMITNLQGNGCNWGGGVCLYDANGTFLSALPASAFSVGGSSGSIANGTFTLPGTQTYVRFGTVFPWEPAGFEQNSGMIYATITGTATLPVTYQPCGLDSIADVSAKDAAVATTAAAQLASALSGSVELALNTVLPSPIGGSRNQFDLTKGMHDRAIHQDGSLFEVSGVCVATVYAPGATEFITNLPIRGVVNGFGVCLLDALGNFLGDISTTTLASSFTVNNCLAPNVVYALPGTQTYVRFAYAEGDLAYNPLSPMFFAGTASDPCPASLPACAAFPNRPSVTVRTASSLGCPGDIDVLTGVPTSGSGHALDVTSVLNAFLATASATNPVKLILDVPCCVTGLVIAAPGHTTIEGIGRSSGIVMAPGSNQDGIRIGVYTAATGQSEGAFNIAAPARSARNIALRNFTVNMNNSTSTGGATTPADQPVAGAVAHAVYGTILANCADVVVEGMNYIQAPWFNLLLSNAGNITVRGCEFVSTGYGKDGVHVDGKCEDITISDCAFATGDDAIALNAPEGYGGDISRVTVTNCRFNNALTVMRIYTSLDPDAMPSNNVHTVRNVVVSNCTGKVTTVCFNLGITNGGLSSTGDVDQLQDLTVSNCSLAAPQGLALLLTPAGSLVFRGIAFTPTGASALISGYSGLGELLLDDVRVLRNPAGNAALDSFVYLYTGFTMDRVALVNCRAIDEDGTSYAAHSSLINNAGTMAALRLEAVDLAHIAALFGAGGTSGIGALRGGGVIGTGAQVPDSIMDNNALYLSSNAGGAPSIKVGGTAKRFALA
jgi:hypothetical protein